MWRVRLFRAGRPFGIPTAGIYYCLLIISVVVVVVVDVPQEYSPSTQQASSSRAALLGQKSQCDSDCAALFDRLRYIAPHRPPQAL